MSINNLTVPTSTALYDLNVQGEYLGDVYMYNDGLGTVADISSTEISYLDGARSNIQDQIDAITGSRTLAGIITTDSVVISTYPTFIQYTFDTTLYDHGGLVSGNTFVLPSDGIYQIVATPRYSLGASTAAAGNFWFRIDQDSSSYTFGNPGMMYQDFSGLLRTVRTSYSYTLNGNDGDIIKFYASFDGALGVVSTYDTQITINKIY